MSHSHLKIPCRALWGKALSIRRSHVRSQHHSFDHAFVCECVCVSYTYSPMATSSGDPPASDDECIVGCETDDSDVIIGDHSDSSDGDNCDGGHSDGGDSDSNAIMDSDGSNVVADDDEEVQLPIAYISRHIQIMCVFA